MNGGNGEEQQAPDVLLDVAQLKVEHIDLNMGQCKARISVDAGLGDLLQVQAGINIEIEDIQLNVKGLEADATFQFRLDQVAEIFRRTLASMEENPDLMRRLIAQSVEQARRQPDA